MKVETRANKRLILLAETKEESDMIDRVMGNKVIDSDGLIAKGTCEVRLSDGYAEHYLLIQPFTEATEDLLKRS